MKFLRKVTESEPLASYIVAPHEPAGNPTDSEWLEYVHLPVFLIHQNSWDLPYSYIRKNIGSIYHPVGTAAMLPQEAGGALVYIRIVSTQITLT